MSPLRQALALGIAVLSCTGCGTFDDAKPATSLGDSLLNWAGRNSVWIGRNRSGGVVSYEKDAQGQFPLGDTRVPGGSAIDRYSRLHDVEYWVSTHIPEGVQVEYAGSEGAREYYVSEGESCLGAVNLRVIGRAIVAPHNLFPWADHIARGKRVPYPQVPVEYILNYDARRGNTEIEHIGTGGHTAGD